MNNICLLGDVMVDVTLKNNKDNLKMRLGGVIHSARALWAISNKYEIAYISPEYLDERIKTFTKTLGNPVTFKIATTTNSPNVILISEPKEIGDQGYELLLRDEVIFDYKNDLILTENRILITLGQFNIQEVLSKIKNKKQKISLELGENSIEVLRVTQTKFENIYVSTSSKIFKEFITNNDNFSFEEFASFFEPYCNQLILKENRGGSRLYSFNEKKVYQVSSQTKPVVHSVGVGDVFNAIFESEIYNNIFDNLTMASFIAMEYASTTFPNNFKEAVNRYMDIPIENLRNLTGITLNWEKRSNINIYLAAPDFDFVDTNHLDLLFQALQYHNFRPRRPIKENGQMNEEDSEDQKKQIYQNDMKILNECQLMIATLLYNDPGTLVEIGIASEKRMPIIIFDPYDIAKNCMLTNSVTFISNNMDEVVSEVFQLSSKL